MLGLDLNLMAGAQAENKAVMGEIVNRGRGHGDGGRTAHKDAADAGPEQNAFGGDGTSRQNGELISTVTLGHPGGFVA
jgi:hypothetical protein